MKGKVDTQCWGSWPVDCCIASIRCFFALVALIRCFSCFFASLPWLLQFVAFDLLLRLLLCFFAALLRCFHYFRCFGCLDTDVLLWFIASVAALLRYRCVPSVASIQMRCFGCFDTDVLLRLLHCFDTVHCFRCFGCLYTDGLLRFVASVASLIHCFGCFASIRCFGCFSCFALIRFFIKIVC